MDFRTCPACQASVLEDDATECPFCGASMTTGKPSGKAQPAASKPASKPAAAPTAAKAAPTSKPKSPARSRPAADSSDPFDVDTSAARKATPVKPRPTKGYMIRVTCPMCERPGFISEAEVGKEVKCANPECLVPIFVANPPREKAPEPEPASEGGGRLWMYGGIGIVVIAGVIAAVMLMNRKPPSGTGPLITENGPGSNVPSEGESPETPAGSDTPVTPKPPAGLSTEQILKRSLAEMRAAGDYAENPRERALAARMLAESLVLTGEPQRARQEIVNLAGASKYLAISPLVIDAWRRHEAGDAAAAKAAVDEAFQLKDSLPNRGREALDIAANLAAVLAATGRIEDAKGIVASESDAEAGEFSAQWRAAVDGAHYRFDEIARRTCLQELTSPEWVAVLVTLAGHGQSDAATAWALAAPDNITRDAACAALAAQWGAREAPGAELTARIEKLAAGLEPSGRVRVWSGAGQALVDRGEKPAAAECAGRAAQELATISLGQPVVVPEMKALYALADAPNRGLPDPLPAQSAALGAFDLFMLQSRLGDSSAAWKQMELALALLRGTAPSVKATGPLVAELDASAKTVRERFKTELGLDDSVALARFSQYQTQLREWDEQARQRRDMEVRLLTRAALAGEVEPVWTLIQAAETSSDPVSGQMYFETNLPGLLQELAAARKIASVTKGIAAAFSKAPARISLTDRTRAIISTSADAADWTPVLNALDRYYRQPAADRALVDAAVLGLLVATMDAQPDAALSLASQISDTLLREDAFWLLGARGVLNKQAGVVLEEFNPRSLPKGAAVSMYRGCVDAAARAKTR